MLAGVTDHQYPIFGPDLLEEGTHLPGAGKARFVQHVEMSAGRIGLLLPCKKALKGVGFDPHLAELARRLGGRSKTRYLIAALDGDGRWGPLQNRNFAYRA